MIRAITALLCLFLASCLEYEADYIVNPDFSAKVLVRSKVELNPLAGMFGIAGDSVNVDNEFEKKFDDFLKIVPQAEAWENVSYKISPDSIFLHIEGTAYVRDIRKSTDSSEASMKQGMLPSFIMEKEDDKINVRVDLGLSGQTGDEEKKEVPGVTEKELTEAEIARQVRSIKKLSGMFSMMLDGMRLKVTYDMPGKLIENKGFPTEGNKLVMEFNGENIYKKVTELMNNDSLLAAEIRNKRSGWLWDPDFLERGGEPDKVIKKEMLNFLFGMDREPYAVFAADDKPRFDYETKVKEIMPEWLEMKKQYVKPQKSYFDYEEREYNEPDPDLRHH